MLYHSDCTVTSQMATMTAARIPWLGFVLLLCLLALVPQGVSAARGGYDPKLIPGSGYFVSTYKARQDRPTLIRNARILTGAGDDLERTDILVDKGVISRMGSNLKPPKGARELDATGKWVTPGLIDLGFGFPSAAGREEGIQWSLLSLVEYRAEQVRALSGGVTTLLFNRFAAPSTTPTSGFALGAVLRNIPDRDLQGTLFPGIGSVLTLHCPEDAAGWRHLLGLWRQAGAYLTGGSEINQDFNLIAAAQKGDLPLHLRCGRAEALALALAFGRDQKLKYRAVTAASEGYQLGAELARGRICAAFFVGQQEGARDLGRANVLAAPLMDAVAGRSGCAIVQSGGTEDIGQLHLLSGRARAQAEALGLQIPPARAIAWITSNPARALGIADKVGSVARGKIADLVVWSGNPFSAYSRPEQIFLDGALIWDLRNKGRQFELDGDIQARLNPAAELVSQPKQVGGLPPVGLPAPATPGNAQPPADPSARPLSGDIPDTQNPQSEPARPPLQPDSGPAAPSPEPR